MVKHDRVFQIFGHGIMILLSIACVAPFILLFISSFTSESALVSNGYSFFPTEVSFDAYYYLLVDSTALIRGYIISICVTTVGTILNLALTVLFAYPLSKRDLPGRNFFSFFIFFTMLFNGGLIPSYMMWTQTFGIKNTWLAYILPNLLMGAFYVIMTRTYFTTNIPEAVVEAARIDGAGEFYILLRIVLPMSTPILATIALLVGLNYWNDWMNGLYYINQDSMYSVQSLLYKMLLDVQYLSSQGGQLGQTIVLPSSAIRMAIATLGVLPVLIVYPFFQNYFVKGITIGAVKG